MRPEDLEDISITADRIRRAVEYAAIRMGEAQGEEDEHIKAVLFLAADAAGRISEGADMPGVHGDGENVTRFAP